MAIIGGLNSVPDVKVLILYILNYAGGRLSKENLLQIALDGGTAEYFDIAQAMDGLMNSGLIDFVSHNTPNELYITELGRETLSVFEHNLPFSVRRKNQSALLRLLADIERKRSVKSRIEEKKNGYEAVCTLLEGEDTLLEYRLFVPTQIQAQKLGDYENTVQIDSQTAQEISKTFAMRELLTQQLKDAKQRLDKAETDARKLSEGFPEYDTISQNETKLRQLADRRPRVRAPLCAAGVLTVVMGISVMLYGLILPGALLAAAGAAAVICAVVFKAKVRIPAQLGMTQKELCAALEKYESAKDKAAQCRAEINNARNELESIQNQLGDCVERCQDIKEKYKISDAESLHKRTKIQAESRARLQSIEALKAQRCELLTDKSKDELEKLALSGTIDSISEAQVNQALLKITEDKSRAIEKIKELSAKGKKYAELSLGLVETKQKEKELNSELENALYNDRVLNTAREALDEAYRYISDMYSPILTECARQPLTEITDGRYDSVMLDRGFNLRVKSGGSMHELGYFSRGTADAVYFAMRTAVSDLISGRQNLPLIMDDPFWSLDDKRLENARRFTEKAAKNRQIIIFSARK